MSVEQKIQELLNRGSEKQLNEEDGYEKTMPMQGSSQKASVENISTGGTKPTVNVGKDNSKAGMNSGTGNGDATMPKQGSSEVAKINDLDTMDAGDNANNVVGKDTSKSGKGSGQGDKTQPMQGSSKKASYGFANQDSIGKTYAQEEVDLSSQLNTIFGEDLSEDFKSKATSIFEAAVIARVNNEMEKVTTKLEEQTAEQLVEFKEALVEKVDGYLNYVVEQWLEENKLAVETGLRTEIAEEFINGMKNLFKEHYIEVPEEKYNVVEELQNTSTELKAQLDESISRNVALSRQLAAVTRAQILEEQTRDLADTEADKLKKLVEGVDFESEDLYREKVSVIKENYFPKTATKSPEKMLVEESGTNESAFVDSNDPIAKYAQALSRAVNSR
ncbi:MAG: hypothetical protein ACO294_08210 [Methylococcales bacterium]